MIDYDNLSEREVKLLFWWDDYKVIFYVIIGLLILLALMIYLNRDKTSDAYAHEISECINAANQLDAGSYSKIDLVVIPQGHVGFYSSSASTLVLWGKKY